MAARSTTAQTASARARMGRKYAFVRKRDRSVRGRVDRRTRSTRPLTSCARSDTVPDYPVARSRRLATDVASPAPTNAKPSRTSGPRPAPVRANCPLGGAPLSTTGAAVVVVVSDRDVVSSRTEVYVLVATTPTAVEVDTVTSTLE